MPESTPESTFTRPSAEPPAQPPGPEPGTRRPWLVLGIMCIGFFMALLDGTIVNIAVPALIHGLDAPTTRCCGSSTRTCSSSRCC